MFIKQLIFKLSILSGGLLIGLPTRIYSLSPETTLSAAEGLSSPRERLDHATLGKSALGASATEIPALPVRLSDPLTMPADIQAAFSAAARLMDHDQLTALRQFRALHDQAFNQQRQLERHRRSFDGVWSLSTAKAARAMAASARHELVQKLDPSNRDQTYDPDRAAYQALQAEIKTQRDRGSSY